MNSVVKIINHTDKQKKSAEELLLETIDRKPKGVIVFIYLDDGSIESCCSGHLDKLTVMGALEAAKSVIWNA